MKFDKILCPSDFSENSEKALNHAVALAGKSNASIEIVHVFQKPYYVAPVGTPHTPEGGMAFFDRVHKDLRKRLATLAESKGEGGVELSYRMLEGVVYDEIAKISGEFDLIVMASHGRTGLERVVLGSVTERVVARSACPVLVVPLHT